jgi:hypothetical protein
MAATQDWSPVNAASEAYWEIEVGLEVLWPWSFFIAPISLRGPAA